MTLFFIFNFWGHYTCMEKLQKFRILGMSGNNGMICSDISMNIGIWNWSLWVFSHSFFHSWFDFRIVINSLILLVGWLVTEIILYQIYITSSSMTKPKTLNYKTTISFCNFILRRFTVYSMYGYICAIVLIL